MSNKVQQLVTAGLLLFLLTIVPAGCGSTDFNSPPPPPPPPPAQLVSLAVTPASPSIAPGTTQQFTATGTYSNGAIQNLTASATWTSSNTAIADINNVGSKGLATASTAAGGTVITATYTGIDGTTALTVSPVASLAVTPANPPSIAPGTAEQFVATGTLADSTLQSLTSWATWTSSDTAVTFVSDAPGSKGLAGATSPGPGGTVTATITATYTGVSGTATFKSSALVSTAVTPTAPSITKGTTQQFTATGTLFDGNTQTLTTLATWSTSSSGVATISNIAGSKGMATAVNEGTATITSLFPGGISGSATLTVFPAILTSLTVTPANPSIALGKTQQFIAMGTFTGGSVQNLTSSVAWSSTNTAVSTISNTAGSNGLASSLGVGTTTIRAISGTISDSTTLTVTAAVLESITVTPASPSIIRGGTVQFAATGNYSDGSTQNLTASVVWNSSNETIATISNTAGSQGLAQANAFVTGTTNITATMSGITSDAVVLTVS